MGASTGTDDLDEMHGGATAFLKGQRDIEKIRHAEEDSLSPSQH